MSARKTGGSEQADRKPNNFEQQEFDTHKVNWSMGV